MGRRHERNLVIAAQTLRDLTGWPGAQAVEALDDAGFEYHHTTRGGYRQWIHPDGSQVWVKPNGEIVRLGPKVKGRSGKAHRPRFDQHGKRTQSHSTGEKLVKE